MDIQLLSHRLAELVAAEYTIDTVDLYGGEIELLPVSYYNELIRTVRQVYTGNINVITNLYMHAPHIMQDNMTLSVSYDFSCRDHSDVVFNNILASPYPIHILMLASQCLVRQDVDFMISVFNTATNIKTVEIKPYSANQSNQHPTTYKQYEQFVQRWIESPNKQFVFVNELRIQEALSGHRNAFSDDHLYITPSGSFAVLEFDINGLEYFKPVTSVGEYVKWAVGERHQVLTNGICGNCKYVGTCLTEHYRAVRDITDSCNGFIHLLDWYDERLENTTTSISQIKPHTH